MCASGNFRFQFKLFYCTQTGTFLREQEREREREREQFWKTLHCMNCLVETCTTQFRCTRKCTYQLHTVHFSLFKWPLHSFRSSNCLELRHTVETSLIVIREYRAQNELVFAVHTHTYIIIFSSSVAIVLSVATVHVHMRFGPQQTRFAILLHIIFIYVQSLVQSMVQFLIRMMLLQSLFLPAIHRIIYADYVQRSTKTQFRQTMAFRTFFGVQMHWTIKHEHGVVCHWSNFSNQIFI